MYYFTNLLRVSEIKGPPAASTFLQILNTTTQNAHSPDGLSMTGPGPLSLVGSAVVSQVIGSEEAAARESLEGRLAENVPLC